MRNFKKHIFILATFLFFTSLIFFLSNIKEQSTFPSESISEFQLPASITVFRHQSGTTESVPLELYTACVLACEMPSSFEVEALKAQAVAARTYVFAKYTEAQTSGNPSSHPSAPVCDSTHCQVYSSKMDLIQTKGIQWMQQDWEKIKKATEDTCSQLLYYNGTPIQYALFHASSGGHTENCEDVFVSAVPYLKSVESPYENTSTRSGHGVGLSQQGANGMAKAGYTYKEILSHYYTGTSVY